MSNLGIKKPENSHIWQRETHEHYVEPAWCSERLFEVEEFTDPIFDPACGFGTIIKSARPGHVIARGEKPGGGKQDFCWLIWDMNHEGAPTIGWLHRDPGN